LLLKADMLLMPPPWLARFAANNEHWIATYAAAFVKMVGTNARYVPGKAIYITGRECPSGWIDQVSHTGKGCSSCNNAIKPCPDRCICASSSKLSKKWLLKKLG
jgi:hypothetical protein